MKISFVTKMAVKPPNNSVATQIKIMLNVLHQNNKREYKSSTIHQIPNRMTAQTFATGDWRKGARARGAQGGNFLSLLDYERHYYKGPTRKLISYY